MSGALSTADWITEAITKCLNPSCTQQQIVPLANFGTVHFSLCFFEDNNPITTDPATLKMVMVDENHINPVKAQPSDFLTYQDISFDVNWVSSGP